MTTHNPLVRVSGKIVELPAGDSVGGALAGANGTNGINGGAVTIGYTFDTTTTDADPGNGKLRLNSSTQNATTSVYLDLVDTLASDWTTVIDTFDDSTNTTKGAIRLVKSGDASKFLTFNVTAVTTATGYRKLTVSNTGSSAASPFANGDAILLCFDRSGDKGIDGTSGYTLLEQHTASSSASLNFTTCISSTYDTYEIEIVTLIPATDAVTLWMRFSTDGGSTYDSGTNYQADIFGWRSSVSPVAIGGGASQTKIDFCGGLGQKNTSTEGLDATARLHTTASVIKQVRANVSFKDASGYLGTQLVGRYVSTTAVNAFQFLYSSGNIASGTIRVYGLAK